MILHWKQKSRPSRNRFTNKQGRLSISRRPCCYTLFACFKLFFLGLPLKTAFAVLIESAGYYAAPECTFIALVGMGPPERNSMAINVQIKYLLPISSQFHPADAIK